MNETQIRNILSKACKKVGSQKSWALAHGLSEPYVCDVLRGRRGVGQSIAEALGYEQIVVYRKAKCERSRHEYRPRER